MKKTVLLNYDSLGIGRLFPGQRADVVFIVKSFLAAQKIVQFFLQAVSAADAAFADLFDVGADEFFIILKKYLRESVGDIRGKLRIPCGCRNEEVV